MENMDILERLKVDIEMLSMSPDENERLISTTLQMAFNEIQHLRKKNAITNIDVGEI